MPYFYIHPKLKTIGTFHRIKRAARGENTDDWTLILADAVMQIRPRRPATSGAIPQLDFEDITAQEFQWYWVRVKPVNLDIRVNDRLTISKSGGRVIEVGNPLYEPLFIHQNDILAHVQHLLLSRTDRNV